MQHWDLSKFFDRSLDLLAIADFNGYFIKLNPRWTQLLGYTNQELTSKPYLDFVHSDDKSKTIEAAQSLAKTGQTLIDFTNRYYCKDGSIKHLMWSVWAEDGVLWAAARDVTRITEIEKSNIAQKKLFENIVNNVPGVVFQFELTSNGTAKFPYLSKQIDQILEKQPLKSADSMDDLFQSIHPDEKEPFKSAIIRSSQFMTEFSWTGRIITPSGNVKWIEIRSTPEKSSSGSITWDGILLDITKNVESKLELEAAKSEAIHASKLSALGEMAAGIAHEVNNPLAIIHGYADRMLRFINSNKLDLDEVKRLSEKIMLSTARIEKTVKSLTALSYRKTDDVYEHKLVSDLIKDTLNISSEKFHSRGINVQISKNVDNITIRCIPIEISQVILNLLNNSYDAIENQTEKWIKIDVSQTKHLIEISISDSGLGIPDEIQSKLWQPFYTSKEVGKGTGLGLSISRRLIEKNNGRLYLDTKSKNTKFIVELPKT